MRFLSVEMKNFGPFEDVCVELNYEGLTLINGTNKDTSAASSNGSGKSHIFKALLWCLFGNTIEGDKYENIIRSGQDATSVAVKLLNASAGYHIERTRKRSGSGSLQVWEDGENVTAATMRETQAYIEQVIGIDFRTFRSTVLYGQNDSSRFAEPGTTDAERKAILMRILKLDALDRALEWVKTERREIERKKAEQDVELTRLEAKLSMLDSGSIESQIAEHKLKLDSLRVSNAEIDELTTLLDLTEAEAGRLPAMRKERDRLLEQVSVYDVALVKHLGEIDTTNHVISGLSQRITRLESGKCPECNSDTSSGTAKETLSALKREAFVAMSRRGELDTLCMSIKDKIDQLKVEARRVVVQISEIEALVRESVPARSDLERLRNLGNTRAFIEVQIADLETDLAGVQAKREKFNDEIVDVEGNVAGLDFELKHVDFWVQGFGASGLKSNILDAVVADLTDRTNEYLAILSDGDITVEFSTETELKSGKMKDALSIDVVVEGVAGVQPSGGQWRKITISADLALMDLLASRSGDAPDLLLLDEVLDGLDGVGQMRVIDLLNHLRTKRRSIYVITHAPGMVDVFERVVKVEKQSGIAGVTICT